VTLVPQVTEGRQLGMGDEWHATEFSVLRGILRS